MFLVRSHNEYGIYERLSCSVNNNSLITMRKTLTAVLMLTLSAGMLVVMAGSAAAQPEFVLQVESLGPLLELIARLFEIDISITG